MTSDQIDIGSLELTNSRLISPRETDSDFDDCTLEIGILG
jgi:hypothetical protein